MMKGGHYDFADADGFVRSVVEREIAVVILCGYPGSGKSRIARSLAERGFVRMSSDAARTGKLGLGKAKFAPSKDDYERYKRTVYGYIRREGIKNIAEGRRVVFDATHLNSEREKLIEALNTAGIDMHKVWIAWVDGGTRASIASRMERKKGKDRDGRSWKEAWEVAYDYFVTQVEKGATTIPKGIEKGCKVLWVKNH